MSARYRHEIRVTGPEDASALIEAAETAGFEVESAITEVCDDILEGKLHITEVDENKEVLTAQRDEARHDLEGLRTRLADRRGEPSD